MSIITRVLRQKGVYWEPSATKGYDGNTTSWLTPVSVNVRWTEKERYHVLESGTQVVSQTSVMTNIDTLKGGFLYLGLLADVLAVTDPRTQVGAWEIMKTEKTPNLRATEFLRIAHLTWQK